MRTAPFAWEPARSRRFLGTLPATWEHLERRLPSVCLGNVAEGANAALEAALLLKGRQSVPHVLSAPGELSRPKPRGWESDFGAASEFTLWRDRRFRPPAAAPRAR